MGNKKTNKLYITHEEHMSGSHSASSSGKQLGPSKSAVQRLPFDSCALSLQPFSNPVAAITDNHADVFELLNIVPYIRKFKTNPVTGKPLDPSSLIKLNFHRNAEGSLADPVSYKPYSAHTHIVFLKHTGNVFDMASLTMLAIKPKTMRDLIDETPFTRSDIITIQDPENLSARDTSHYDYVKADKKVDEGDLKSDPLRNINVEAAGGASKILKMIAQKTKETTDVPAEPEPPKEGIIASRPKAQKIYNASNFSMGQASASFTSSALEPSAKNETAMFDEEEYMFDEFTQAVKDKDRLKCKGYASIQTNMGTINVELHGDRAPKTCYNWIMLAKAGKYDNVPFHRLIPGFMLQGGDPTGTGRGGVSHWGGTFRDEYDVKGAYKHDSKGVMSMANHGPSTNGSQFFFTFRSTPHLDKKHTVFGKIVSGTEVLSAIEAQPTHKSTDRPLTEIKILGVTVVEDPFKAYQERLAQKIAKTDVTDEVLAERAAKRAKRESDRTTWLGTDLGQKGAKAKATDDDDAGVGKYLAAAKASAKRAAPSDFGSEVPSSVSFGGGGAAKKPKKAGGFGDFSGW